MTDPRGIDPTIEYEYRIHLKNGDVIHGTFLSRDKDGWPSGNRIYLAPSGNIEITICEDSYRSRTQVVAFGTYEGCHIETRVVDREKGP